MVCTRSRYSIYEKLWALVMACSNLRCNSLLFEEFQPPPPPQKKTDKNNVNATPCIDNWQAEWYENGFSVSIMESLWKWYYFYKAMYLLFSICTNARFKPLNLNVNWHYYTYSLSVKKGEFCWIFVRQFIWKLYIEKSGLLL